MANLRISELAAFSPLVGTEYFEVIIPPYSPGTNRRVLMSEVLAYAGGGSFWPLTGNAALTGNVNIDGATFNLDLGNFGVFQVNATDIGLGTSTGGINITGTTYVDILASGSELNLQSTIDDVNIDAGANINLALIGELTVNTDPGTATQVLTSNGPGVPPTWEDATVPGILNEQTADYGLLLADENNTIIANSGSAIIITVPLNSSQAFPINTTIPIYRNGAGAVTIAAAGGVTINSSSGTLGIENRYASVLLKKVDTDIWILLNGSPPLGWTALGQNLTGFSAVASYDVTYVIEGKRCTIIGSIQGTHNTTNPVTLNNLPAVCRLINPNIILVQNNATVQSGRADIGTGGSSITFYATPGGTNFTNSVTCNLYFTITYEIQ